MYGGFREVNSGAVAGVQEMLEIVAGVGDHEQFVVQSVLTRSSNTVGLASIRPAPVAAHVSMSEIWIMSKRRSVRAR